MLYSQMLPVQPFLLTMPLCCIHGSLSIHPIRLFTRFRCTHICTQCNLSVYLRTYIAFTPAITATCLSDCAILLHTPLWPSFFACSDHGHRYKKVRMPGICLAFPDLFYRVSLSDLSVAASYRSITTLTGQSQLLPADHN